MVAFMAPDHDLSSLLDVRQNELSLIFEINDSIDTKDLALLCANLAILIFVGQASLNFKSILYEFILISSFIVSILLNVIVIWPWGYAGTSVNLDEHPDYLEMDSLNLQLQLISDTETAIKTNRRQNYVRWRFVLASFLLSSLGTVILFVII
jgi:hypothetical protein